MHTSARGKALGARVPQASLDRTIGGAIYKKI